VIPDDEFVLDRHRGRFQFSDGADNSLARQVARWVVVLPDHEYAGVVPLRLLIKLCKIQKSSWFFVTQTRPSPMARVK
jgi:hypothetical protein